MTATDTTTILDSIKKLLAIQPDYEVFDEEILMHINSVMSNLTQLGLGSADGFIVKSETQWKELLTNDKLENVKMYIFLKVKMVFDAVSLPPSLIEAYKEHIAEQEWRIVQSADPMIPWPDDEMITVGEE